MRSAVVFVAAGLGLAAGSLVSPVAAQPQAPTQNRPTFSPYLNLLRSGGFGGGSPALNYLGLVRPELQLRQQANTIQQQVMQNSQTIQGINNEIASGGADPSLPITGRGASFGNYSHYFPGLGGGGSGIGIGSRAGAGQAPQRAAPSRGSGGAGLGGRGASTGLRR